MCILKTRVYLHWFDNHVSVPKINLSLDKELRHRNKRYFDSSKLFELCFFLKWNSCTMLILANFEWLLVFLLRKSRSKCKHQKTNAIFYLYLANFNWHSTIETCTILSQKLWQIVIRTMNASQPIIYLPYAVVCQFQSKLSS